MAAKYGFELEDAQSISKQLYIKENVFSEDFLKMDKELRHLPTSCWQSSNSLERNRHIYEINNVFPPDLIDGIIKKLRSYHDQNLSEELFGKIDDIKKLVDQYLYAF